MKRYILVGNKIKKLREFLFIKFYTTVKEFTNTEYAKNELKLFEIQEHNTNLHSNISKNQLKNFSNIMVFMKVVILMFGNLWLKKITYL